MSTQNSSLSTLLEDERQHLLEALGGLSTDNAAAKLAPDRWSVLECVEHLAIIEERFFGWIVSGREISADSNWEKQTKLFNMATDRSFRVQAPEAALPTGRFATLGEAIEAFNAARNRTARVVSERGQALYTVGIKHPRFGDMNGVELVHVLTGHARRHAAQIREIRESLGC